MTDITNHDRRVAMVWAKNWQGDIDADASAAARYILATVGAPEPTLEEELRHIAEYWEEWATDTITSAIRAAADRAEQTEQERDHFFREVENVRNWKEQLLNERDEARAEVERLTAERLDRNPETKARVKAALNNLDKAETVTVQKGAESNAETPNPADVKPGEAWRAHIWYGDERHPGTAIKNHGGDWTVCCRDGTRSTYRMNEYLDLIAPLVPEVDMTHILTEAAHDIATTFAETLGLPVAPRVITNPDELDQLAATSIIRDGRGWPGGVTDQGVTMINGFCVSDEEVLGHGPVTVLWEPGA